MIRLPERTLEKQILEQLSKWQLEIDSQESFLDRKKLAIKRYKQLNKAENKIFLKVRETLRSMCGGIERCAYCEDSHATSIDHFRPKTCYPELTFVWENYVPACPSCNQNKGDGFALDQGSESTIELDCRKQTEAPPQGSPVLIDPRQENPSDLLDLDLNTGLLLPHYKLPPRPKSRASYTIKRLRLNDDALVRARQAAYEHFVLAVKAFIYDSQHHTETLKQTSDAIHRSSHPMVWQEMKRQYLDYPVLADLFRKAPELLDI
ncbi:hypothetical protein ANRL4_02352 [Anaerolineae bacterium]|nr:hypothetical protein ANRL4_02352 [Anaerolineae bacterium]